LCEFCTKHGEGKKWYEVMENYSQELLADKSRKKYIEGFIRNVRSNALKNIDRLEWSRRKLPFAYRMIRKMATASVKSTHYGQVIPLEDAEKIADMVSSVTRIACVCRSVTAGKNDARYCLVLGIDPSGAVKDWPELESSLETLTTEEAKKLLRQFDREGLVHSVWTFKTPFIGAICNCSPDCLAYQLQVVRGLMDIMFRAEYEASIDPLQCVGCRNCKGICQFDAVGYSVENRKCFIDPLKCYGCGVCRSVCKKDAVVLVDKIGFPCTSRRDLYGSGRVEN